MTMHLSCEAFEYRTRKLNRNAVADFLFYTLAGNRPEGDRLFPLTREDFEACRTVMALPDFTHRMEDMMAISQDWMTLGEWWDDLCTINNSEREAAPNRAGSATEASLHAAYLTEFKCWSGDERTLDSVFYPVLQRQHPQYAGRGWMVFDTFKGVHSRSGKWISLPNHNVGLRLCKFGEPPATLIVPLPPLARQGRPSVADDNANA